MTDVERAVFPRAAGRASGGLELRCVIFARRGEAVVLIRHRRHPIFEDAWTLPGGTLEYGVNPRESAARILRDQTGIAPESMRLLGIHSSVEGEWILTFEFEATVSTDPAPEKGAAEARLVGLDRAPTDVHPLTRSLLESYRIHELAKAF